MEKRNLNTALLGGRARSEVITGFIAQSGLTEGEVILLLKLCSEDGRQRVFYIYAVGGGTDLFGDLGGIVLRTVQCFVLHCATYVQYFFILQG